MTEPSVGRDVDLSAAFDSTMSVLRKVEPDDLAKPTPCASWDVRALVNHIIGAARWWAAMVSGDPGLEAAEGEDYTAGDVVAAYEAGIGVTLGAFAAEGAAERIVTAPFGRFPGEVLAKFAATDQFQHGWDLARALGQDTDLAPGLSRSGIRGCCRLSDSRTASSSKRRPTLDDHARHRAVPRRASAVVSASRAPGNGAPPAANRRPRRPFPPTVGPPPHRPRPRWRSRRGAPWTRRKGRR